MNTSVVVIALLLLLAIVCAYSWVAYKIKTTVPKVGVTVPKPHELGLISASLRCGSSDIRQPLGRNIFGG